MDSDDEDSLYQEAPAKVEEGGRDDGSDDMQIEYEG